MSDTQSSSNERTYRIDQHPVCVREKHRERGSLIYKQGRVCCPECLRYLKREAKR